MPERLPPDWWPHRAASECIDVGALRWHVQRWRHEDVKAPAILLLHGTGASSHSWRHVAPLLTPHGHVIAPDLPGHAFTHTPAAQALSLPAVAAALGDLLDALQCRPALVVGHSAGAAIALRMALARRIAPAQIVAINGAILPLQGLVGRSFLPLARVMAASTFVAPAFATWVALPTMTRRLLNSTGSRIDALGERCYGHLVRDAGHASGALRLMASWDLKSLESELPLLKSPLLLIAGDNDRTVSPVHALRAQQRMPGAQRVNLKGLGHLAHEESHATAELVVSHVLHAWRAASPGAAPVASRT